MQNKTVQCLDAFRFKPFDPENQDPGHDQYDELENAFCCYEEHDKTSLHLSGYHSAIRPEGISKC